MGSHQARCSRNSRVWCRLSSVHRQLGPNLRLYFWHPLGHCLLPVRIPSSDLNLLFACSFSDFSCRYITFGRWDAARKRILLLVCLPLLLTWIIVAFTIFYTTQFECAGCAAFNCLEFTPSFCEDNNQHILDRALADIS
eukprot:m.677298 g.677298  ORF g.677298 m.677298 type:complete len:139 (+) comp58572_c0_seq1:2021-2437(+)